MSETIAESRPSIIGLGRSYHGITKQIWYGADVTDNITDRQHKLSEFPISMEEKYQSEEERLKTFAHWPLQWLNKKELAQTGLFYTGVDDIVKCYFCEVEIGLWEPNDQPLSEHLRFSPNCPLLRRRTTNNIPLNPVELNSILPPPSYDVCGNCGNEDNELRPPNSYTEGSIPEALMQDAALQTPSNSSSAQPYRPKYPEYAIESARLRSFAEWPRNMKQKPQQLAEAGFFYTGTGDRVKCFSCGCGLKDWDDDDEPWEQHALWLPKCRYLNLIKGQAFIDSVMAKLKPNGNAVPTTVSLDKPINGIVMPQKPMPQQQQQQQQQQWAETTMNMNVNSGIAERCAEALPQQQQQPQPQHLQSEPSTSAACELKALPKQQQQQQQHTIAEEKLCKICYAEEYNTAFLPCGHVVACAKCASSVSKCPVCREPFTNVMRVFFS